MEFDAPEDRESLRAQLQQAFETTRFAFTLFIQVTGFLIASDVLLLGYGLSQKRSGALLAAALMPICILFALWRIMTHLLPVAYVAIRLEARLLPGETSLARTYFHSRSPALYSQLVEIVEAEDPDVISTLRENRSLMSFGTGILPLTVCCGAAIQLTLFILSITAFHYRFM